MNGKENQSSADYMRTKVVGVLEDLTTELLFEKPFHVVDFMEQWLATKGEASMNRQIRKKTYRPLGIESSESEDDEMDDDAFTQIEEQIPVVTANRKTRMAVSAEVNSLNEEAKFNPKYIHKDSAAKALLKSMIHEIFLFSHLENHEIETLVDIMEVQNIGENEQVINQGDQGDRFYIVKSGKLKCLQSNDKGVPEIVRMYYSGDYFGELALLYNVPRAATIVSVSPSVLFTMDRTSFNFIVVSSIRKAREQYLDFLSQVEIFKTLTPVELERLCDSMKVEKLKRNEIIIKKGVRGDTFFIVLEGKARAFDEDPETNELFPVAEYHEGMYFGELALIRHQPRAMHVIAQVT